MDGNKYSVCTDINVAASRGTGVVHVDYDDAFFAEDSAVYNHNLARFCAQMSIIGYDMPPKGDRTERGIVFALEKLGMNSIETYSESLEDEVNLFFASRKMCIDNREYFLVFAGLLGSRLGQWYTNFDSGTGETHKGFEKCRDFVLGKLTSYVSSLGISRENTKILITGHSRGGAVSNLLASYLVREESLAVKENVFTYTFASPSVTMKAEKDDGRFRRIFNIVNDEDFVTKCMLDKWGYGRYGLTLSLPNKNNSAGYDKILEIMNRHYAAYMSGDTYKPFKKGTKTVDRLFDAFAESVSSISEYYTKQFRSPHGPTTLYSYFSDTLCSVTGEPEGSAKKADGTKLLLKTSFLRHKSSKIIKAIADFFVFYEGLAGATGGKISDTYFSFGHNIHTYCALLMAVEEKELFGINGI